MEIECKCGLIRDQGLGGGGGGGGGVAVGQPLKMHYLGNTFQ